MAVRVELNHRPLDRSLDCTVRAVGCGRAEPCKQRGGLEWTVDTLDPCTDLLRCSCLCAETGRKGNRSLGRAIGDGNMWGSGSDGAVDGWAVGWEDSTRRSASVASCSHCRRHSSLRAAWRVLTIASCKPSEVNRPTPSTSIHVSHICALLGLDLPLQLLGTRCLALPRYLKTKHTWHIPPCVNAG